MTDIEQRLVEATKRGTVLECTDDDQAIPAGLIRELLLGGHGDLDPRGVQVVGARIEGSLNLDGVEAKTRLGLVNCTFDEPIEARYANVPGLTLDGIRCPGFYADGLRVDGDLFMRERTRISANDKYGAIRLLGAHITGDFSLSGAEVTNTSGAALYAAGLIVNGHVFMRGGLRVNGHGADGAVTLVAAQISGNLEVADAKITNTTGSALNLNGIRVDRDLFLRRKVHITGNGDDGAVDLIGGHIGQDLEFRHTEVANASGPAVLADRVVVGGALFLLGRTRFSGGGGAPVVNLNGARVGGKLSCESTIGFEVKTPSSPALNLAGMTVAASARLPLTLACRARERDRKCATERWVRVDDFAYTSLGPGWDWQKWLHLVRCHTPAYHASAYQRLAAVERAAGHDGTVRRILMAQQTDLRRRSPESLGGFMTRRFHWLWGVLAGYGYRARRTAAALLVVLTIAGALGWWAGQVPTRPGHLAAERVTTGVPCSTVELIGLGLDRGLPLAMTGMRARCDLDTASKKGQAFTAAIWLVQLAVWGLATLALAGYTNLVRKPG